VHVTRDTGSGGTGAAWRRSNRRTSKVQKPSAMEEFGVGVRGDYSQNRAAGVSVGTELQLTSGEPGKGKPGIKSQAIPS